MGYRFWMSSKFSTSLAFYSSYSMGEPQIVYDNFAPGTTIDTSARDTTEYGLDWALQAELWQSGRYALILDGRYSLSFTNKRQEQSNHYGVLFGIRYFIQEQQIRKKTKTDL
jgi:hypothetical protein